MFMLERVVFMLKRTIYCGALRESAIGKNETVCGWVQTKRDMGGVVFIDLRDREGILQVGTGPQALGWTFLNGWFG